MKLRGFIILSLLTGFLAGFTQLTSAQERVRILETDSLEGYSTEEDGQVRKLIGNVVLETEDFTVRCDTAWHYRDLEELRARGNIQIDTDDEIIWADEVFYDLATEYSEFKDRVILNSDGTTLFSDFLAYDFIRDIAEFPESLRMEDEDGTLIADRGTYFNEPDSAAFFGNVQLEDTTQYIEADSMFTVRKDEYYELHSRVFLHDLEEEVRLTGNFVEADSTGYRRIEDNARMQRLSEDRRDTTFIWSDRMDVWEHDTTHVFEAYDNVHIWTENYSSLSDTAAYDDYTELFELSGSPRTWRDNLQLTGPHIEIQLEDDEVKTLYSYPNPFSTEEDEETGRFNQLTGDTLFINFEEGELDFMEVWENAHMLYHNNDEEGNPDGATELETPYLYVTFVDGDIYRLNTKGQSPGTIYPEAESVKELRLTGFTWEPDLRPAKPDEELERRLLPIPTERPFEYPDRYRAFIEELVMRFPVQP